MSQDPSTETLELIDRLRSERDLASGNDPSSDTLNCLSTACQLIDILTSRIQALDGDLSQVNYAAMAQAQREEAEAKRDLAQLLLGAARSVTSWFRPTVRQ